LALLNDAAKHLPQPILAFAIKAGRAKHLTNAPAGTVVRPLKLEFARMARANLHATTRLLLRIIGLRRRGARSRRRDRAGKPRRGIG
jgi:hypothetical protein